MKLRDLRNTWFLVAGGLLLSGLQAGCQSTSGGDRLAWKSPFATSQASATAAPQGDQTPLRATGSFLLEVAKGRNLEEAGNWDEAREVYKRLIARYPERSEAYHRLGVVADRQRRYDEAQRLYTQALQRDPLDAELFNDLGYCFYLQGKLAKAESALAKATLLEPDNARYRNNLGMVLGQQQRYDEAFDHFAAAGSEADAYYNLAFVYASQDLHDRAKACFQQALQVDPTHDQAREALASFQQYDQRQVHDEELAGLDDVRDGVSYVPYVERSLSDSDGSPPLPAGSQTNPGVRNADYEGLLSPQREAARSARLLHQSSEGLLQRHFASQRQDNQQ